MRRPHAPATLCLLLGLSVPAQVADWHRLPALTSSASKGLAYDYARQRMVLFESSGWGGMSRTWEWVADAWSLRRTATAPPPRHAFAFGYDVLRARCVMFGGSTQHLWSMPNAALADTWEYDGIDWVQRFPTTSPPPQIAGWMGFDFANWKLLLCGSTSAQGPAGSWHFDGTTWTLRPAAPFFAYLTAIASDPARQRIVAQTHTGQTFEWDGTAWLQQQPAGQPPPRVGSSMAFVAQRGAVVLHGGYANNTNATGATDLWQWDGTRWSRISAPAAPARSSHTMAHDPVRNRTFVVGGFEDANLGSETLQWDGTTWHHSAPGIGWEVLGNAAFDPVRQRTIGLARTETIEWDGARWSLAPPPPGLNTPTGVAFDAVRARTVAVGTVAGGAVHTWEHDGVAWSAPMPTPQLQLPGWLVYHAGRGAVVCCTASSLREWNGTTWNTLGPGHGLFTASAAYDAGRNEIVVAGSWTAGGTLMTFTWNGSWTSHQPTSSPPVRVPSWGGGPLSLGYDELRQRVVLFGGRDPVTGPGPANFFRFFGDLWEWDGANWSQRVLVNAPPPRELAAIVFDRARQQLLVLGGQRQEFNGAYLMFSDVWALDATAVATVTTLGPGCGGVNPAPALVPSAPHPGAPAFTLDVHGPQANAPCLFLFALANASTQLGAGCTLFAPAPDLIAFTITDQNGLASTHTAIPLALQGLSFSAQAAVLDGTSPLGFATTQGLRIVVGR